MLRRLRESAEFRRVLNALFVISILGLLTAGILSLSANSDLEKANLDAVNAAARDLEAELRKQPLTTTASSSDGVLVFSVSAGGEVTVWDVATGREVANGHNSSNTIIPKETTTIAFVSDGALVFSFSAGGEFRVWDVATGREVANSHDLSNTIIPPESPVALGSVSSYGTSVVDSVTLWDVSVSQSTIAKDREARAQAHSAVEEARSRQTRTIATMVGFVPIAVLSAAMRLLLWRRPIEMPSLSISLGEGAWSEVLTQGQFCRKAAGRLILASAGILPSPEDRERWTEEWAADLEAIPKAHRQLSWAIGVRLFAAPGLRKSISEQSREIVK